MPVTSLGFLRKSWKSPHSPWPAVAPNEAGCASDMSNTIDFAFGSGASVARVIASGYTLALMLWLPVPKPPDFAHAAAAAGVARNVTNARTAGVSRKAMIESPPISIAFPPEPLPIVGNTAALKSVIAFDFVNWRITWATKSASKTIAAFGEAAKAFVTESLKLYWSAPDVPPATFEESPTTCAIVFSALITVGLVHLILCVLRRLYLAAPY